MRRSRRMLLTAAVTALLPAAALLSSGLTAPATGASLPTLAQAFDNVGITSASHAAAGNYDGIGDSFSASGLAADALVARPVAAARRADDHLARRRARRAGQRGRRRPDDRGQPGPAPCSASSAPPRTAAPPERSPSATPTAPPAPPRSRSPTGSTPAPPPAPTCWPPRRAGTPAARIPVSLSYAAIPLTAGKQVTSVTLPTVGAGVGKNVSAMHIFSLTIGSPGRRGAPARPAPPPTTTRPARTASAPPRTPRPRPGTRSRTATLSDVYAPTIDNTDVKSLDPIVTGPGFTALQPRDMTYSVASLDATGMACEVTAQTPRTTSTWSPTSSPTRPPRRS